MYNEKAVKIIEDLENIIESSGLSLIKARKLNGILNAIEMQIEDYEYNLNVVEHLSKAFIELAKVYQVDTNKIENAFKKLQKKLQS